MLIVSTFYVQGQAPNPYRLKKVVIDAGHGGKDPGAIGKKSQEKDIALKVALKLGAYIKQYIPDVEVIYTRKTDVFIELDKRSAVANEIDADLFISIHVNASEKKSIIGTSTFVMGLNKASENLEAVKRENAVVKLENNYKSKYQGFDPDSPESEIIFSLYQNAFLEQSISLASKVQNQFKTRTSQEDRGVRQAGLVVLWNCTMPSILVEIGFITNEKEERYLMSDNGQAIIASAIFRAFRAYKNEIEKKNGNNISQNHKQKTKNIKQVKNTKAEAITYKVQIAFSIRKLEPTPQNFKGVKNIERTLTGKKYRYTVGNTSSFDEILELQNQIRTKIPDAYVIAFENGKQISVKAALDKQKKK